jgi:hypothetical protein
MHTLFTLFVCFNLNKHQNKIKNKKQKHMIYKCNNFIFYALGFQNYYIFNIYYINKHT